MAADSPPDDMMSVSLAERLAEDRARRAQARARLPAFFFGVMFAVALGSLFLKDGPAPEGGETPGGFDPADATLVVFAALAFVMGVFGEDRVRTWLKQDRPKPDQG